MATFISNQDNKLIVSACSRYGIEVLVLFGSSASGTAHERSDVDLAVKLAMGKQISKLAMIRDLENIIVNRQIDLTVITPNTDPLLLFEIFSNGRPLYEEAPGIFEKNKLKAWHLFLDTIPIRQLEKTYNKDRIRALANVT